VIAGNRENGKVCLIRSSEDVKTAQTWFLKKMILAGNGYLFVELKAFSLKLSAVHVSIFTLERE